MKKLLSILSIGIMVGSTTSQVTSCNTTNHNSSDAKKINPLKNYNPLLSISDAVFGNSNDFTLIMENDDFAMFEGSMKNNKNQNEYNTNAKLDSYLPNAKTITNNIDDETWNNIFNDLYKNTHRWASVANGYIGILHIENNKFKYTNISSPNDGSKTNIKTVDMHPQNKADKLITAAIPFSDDEVNKQSSILINKSLINTLNTDYQNKELNIENISMMLKNSSFQFSDNKPENIEKCLLNLFTNNYSIVKNILNDKNIDNGIVLNFDENNNYKSTN